MQKTIAFFDFDGTITTKDTMLEMARFCRGDFYYWFGLAIIAPWLLAMKLRLVSKAKAKEKLLKFFFGNTNLESFNYKCFLFSEEVLPSLIKKDAFVAIQNHLAENTPVVIVSASAENWVAPWCLKHNIQFICTQLKIQDNKITGALQGENCNGKEKVSRIKQLFNLADYSIIYCYGDTNGDKLMLQLATHPHYRVFRN